VWRWAKSLDEYQRGQADVLVLGRDEMTKRDAFFFPCQQIRKTDPSPRSFFLTSKSQTEDVVKGFGTWWDELFAKALFSMEELIVRISPIGVTFGFDKNQSDWIAIFGNYSFQSNQQFTHFEKEVVHDRTSFPASNFWVDINEMTDRSLF